jgi:hypothetical protein
MIFNTPKQCLARTHNPLVECSSHSRPTIQPRVSYREPAIQKIVGFFIWPPFSRLWATGSAVVQAIDFDCPRVKRSDGDQQRNFSRWGGSAEISRVVSTLRTPSDQPNRRLNFRQAFSDPALKPKVRIFQITPSDSVP